MKKRKIGSLEVSVVGLGGNNFGTDFFGSSADQAGATRIIHAALDAGVTFIDTAEEYSIASRWGNGRSEEFIGEALGTRRNDVVIASKFLPENPNYPGERGAKRIMHAVEDSLRRLGTDRIDLYQQHFPDAQTPPEEIMEALDRLVRDGKVREIGCSNFTGAMIDAAQGASATHGWARFASVQSQMNLLDSPPDGTLESCERYGMKLIPYFPLASGLLTGKYKRNAPLPAGSRFGAETKVTQTLQDIQINDARLAKVEELSAFAASGGHTILELAISWLTSQPVVASVICGATKPEQIEANARAAEWELTAEDFRDVATILDREPA